MKLIFTYDNKELKELGGIINSVPVSEYIHVLTEDKEGKKKNLYDVAVDIKEKIPKSESCIIFIHQYLACADEGFEWLQRNAGIALIKFLRMMEVRSHIVLITPFSGNEIELVKHSPENLIVTSKGISFAKYLHELRDKTISDLNALTTIDNTAEKKNLLPYFRAEIDFINEIDHSFANEYGIELMFRAHQGITGKKLSVAKEIQQRLLGLIAKADFLYQYEKSNTFKTEGINLREKLLNIPDENKKIVCIDDQGNAGWFNFYDNLLYKKESDLFTPVPFKKNSSTDNDIKDTIIVIRKKCPDLVLLDLRLYGDSERLKKIEDISGYKVLQEIKKTFPALPVIITSATNKSDNLSALLKANAFGLWTKPRIEQGNIDIYEKYYNLLSIIHDALTFYKYEEEKIPIKADYLISTIADASDKVKNYLNQYDLIITDTNCWMMGLDSKKTIDKVAELYKNLVLTSKTVDKSNFLVIDDMKRELADHLHKILTQHTSIDQLNINSIMANYGFSLLNKIIKEQSIYVFDRHLIDYKVGSKFNFQYSIDGDKIIETCYELYNKKPIYIRDYGIVRNETIRNNLYNKLRKRMKVHADDSFINIIYFLLTTNEDRLSKRNIIFISEDIDCRDKIYYLIKEKLNLIDDSNELPITKDKNNIKKVRSGKLIGKDNNKDISLTLIDPFDFSEKIESSLMRKLIINDGERNSQ